MTVFVDLLNLLLPSNCIFCNSSGDVICGDCQTDFALTPQITARGMIFGATSCDYDEPTAALIREFKTKRQTELARFMAKQIVRASEFCGLAIPDRAVLVPIPTSATSFAERGFNPAKLLSDQISICLLQSSKKIATSTSLLRITRATEDQASLNAAQRRHNLVNSMSLTARADLNKLRASSVWLVDDIVTTGATLGEANRAFAAQGIPVAGFLAFAETRLHDI